MLRERPLGARGADRRRRGSGRASSPRSTTRCWRRAPTTCVASGGGPRGSPRAARDVRRGSGRSRRRSPRDLGPRRRRRAAPTTCRDRARRRRRHRSRGDRRPRARDPDGRRGRRRRCWRRGGAPVVVDGDAGEVVIDPEAERVARRPSRRWPRARRSARARNGRPRPSRRHSRRPRRCACCATPRAPPRCDAGLEAGAEGAGLIRTELAFLDAPDVADRGASTQRARPGARQRCAGRIATVRVLDFGGDKTPPFLRRTAERGLRCCSRRRARSPHRFARSCTPGADAATCACCCRWSRRRRPGRRARAGRVGPARGRRPCPPSAR